ncbi:E3 ubiquitin-protein ligase PRT6 [Phalaenopsis equestris]|uniref:E3 ubiquitin-protein ligase PRT6 n=1 Tax=Phalaenopsis equestris TaxID=78828 RepID=UPI0009E1DBEC|nr:E3 ubiquitin-protein ligase PRT6 [Phalaenopsis equestris]
MRKALQFLRSANPERTVSMSGGALQFASRWRLGALLGSRIRKNLIWCCAVSRLNIWSCANWLRVMAGMEIDSPPERDNLLPPRDRIVQRLAFHGIPQVHLQQFQLSLVAFVRDNKCMLSEIVSSILPTSLDLSEAQMLQNRELAGVNVKFTVKELFEESILWLQWLMFDGDPQEYMSSLAQSAEGQRAVCGAVWGQNDLAYRCRTCEHDPTCAICVPCFQNGNHKDHDYNIMYTGGGCCDCGDETAWKKEGFCSEHKGTEQIRPLPQELANSIGPVLDPLLLCWKKKLLSVEHRHDEEADHGDACKKAADGLSSAIIQMLIDFCNCSESLLSFISRRLMSCSGLLDVLLKADKHLDKEVVKRLRELLLKLLGDPLFKYDFAKVFIQYYPTIVNEMIKYSSDSYSERDPMLATFSVQIFTVPTLTMRLVTEVDLLSVLLGCLKDLFLSCADANGHLQFSKWGNMYETIRLIEDFRYVMSHQEVPAYIVCKRPDISKKWIFLLRLVQGMDALKRVTVLHSEEENENLFAPFALGQCLSNVNSLLVGGAFYNDKNGCLDKQDLVDIDRQRHAKVGRVSQESSASRTGALEDLIFNETRFVGENGTSFPSSVVWLISECLKAIECWLRPEIESLCYSSSFGVATTSASNISSARKKLFKVRKGPNSINGTSMTRMDMDGEEIPFTSGGNVSFGSAGMPEAEGDISETNELFPGNSYSTRVSDDTLMEVEYGRESATFSILNMTDWPAINFDVGSQAISFHIPLHRLLSLLLRKALKACDLIELPGKTNGATTTIPIHNHEFFRKALAGLHPCGFSGFIMEHPLQLMVFCAQVRAGMWRKNSDAPILCSQWLEQGLESDLFLLQCCAALAPPDSFVESVLERYGLSNYMSLNLAEYDEYESVLVQEMLTLFIRIVKERRFCGSSTAANLQRELVYRLAIGDATHSQLVKSLPRDLSKSDKLQNAVDLLAVYSNPSGMKQGKYSLRKAYWKELDLYHPRWGSRDLQVAEERFFRFCKVSALNAQLPRWTPIFEPLFCVCRIATSKMVLQIVRVVFFYACFSERSSISRAPDAVLITALHLVSLALNICETQLSLTDDPPPILTSASEEFDLGSCSVSVLWKNQSMLSLLVSLMRKYKEQTDDVYSETSQCNISSLIEALLKKFAQLNANCMSELQRLAPSVICNEPQVNCANQSLALNTDIDERKLKARQRQAAILEKMKAEQSKFIESLSSNNIEQESYKKKESFEKVEVREQSLPVCSLCHDPDSSSPLCLLILLQKSKLTSFVDRGPPIWEDAEQLRREVSSAGKLKSVDSSGPCTFIPLQLSQIAGPEVDHDVEPIEIDTFFNFIRDQIPDIGNFQLPKVSQDNAKDPSFCLELMENYLFHSIMEDVHESQSYSHSTTGEQNSTSVVDSNITRDSGSVLQEYVACLSRISSKQQSSSLYDILHHGNLSSKSKGTVARVIRFGPKDCDGIHISSCGHAVHQDCHERYLGSLKQRNIRRLGFEGGHIIDPDLGELLCPVCRRFANSVLPAVPCPADKYGKSVEASPKIAGVSNVSQLPLALSLLHSAGQKAGHGRFLKNSFGKLRETIKPALEPSLHKLYTLYYPYNYNDLSSSGRVSQSLVLWDTLRYSLVSTEIAARGRVRASTANSTLKSLYGELHSSSGFILPSLLNVAKSTCSSNSIEVLLRFRGIQLLSKSICFGVSEDSNLSNSDKRRGSLKLEHTESGESFPDIQFWKRATDPILAHDPFSSLMWVLFCLPSSFMQSNEFFIPLVHLFYVVSLIQSLITCYCKDFFDASHFCDSLLCDLCKVLGKSSRVKKYFVSNYIDPSCHPKDMIRRLTFPFLRRCALLWKLLQSSNTAIFNTSNIWEGLNPHAKTDTLEVDNANYFRMELDGIKELEDLFHVSSFELILKDEVVNSLALKWCKHFCDELKTERSWGILYYTPAVPFKLMQLPRIYQHLLQRYVKVKCSECKSISEEPALCLLCGKLCSPSWKSCCRASRCLNHAISCGAGIGVFLLVRKTTILLQRCSRQAFWPPPYLDAFGEEDIDVCRGKPLFLNTERYAALTYLVASHGLDRTSEVLRQTTISVFGSD